MAGESDFKTKMDCWSKYQDGDIVHKDDATQMIRYMFEISIDMLKSFLMIKYEDVDLLMDEDYN